MSNEQIVHNFEIPNVFSNSQQPVIVQLQPGQPLPPGAVVVNPQHINNSQQVFQPPQPNVQAQSTREWTTSLFECTKDEETCWWGLWYCWLVNARSIHSFGLSTSFSEIAYFWSFVVAFILSTLLFGIFGFVIFGSVLTALYAYRRSSYRSEIRTRFHIHGSNSDDFLTSCLCPCCAVCQEAREGKAVNVPVLDFCSGEELKIQQESHERAVGGLNVTEGSVSVDNGSLMDHVYALSKTSRIILIAWIGVFVIASLILLATKRGLSVVVMFLIFAQPLLILYFVYWRSRRMYAALDYVVKLFAVGFWVSTFQSIVLEAALQFVIVLILSPFAGGTPDEDATDDEKRDLLAKHMGVVVIAMLCMAFIVAAGVEETMKHFAVRCCRFSSTIQSPHTILVYLMTAALGFATSENIEYVFSATADPGEKQITMFYQEVTVYALRILMPIHVICSVMQAANLSRVVTGLKSMNLFQVCDVLGVVIVFFLLYMLCYRSFALLSLDIVTSSFAAWLL